MPDFPTFSQAPSHKKNAVRGVIEHLLLDDAVFTEMLPYLVEEGVCGHKLYDLSHAVTILKKGDALNGNRLQTYGHNDYQLGNHLKQVIRTRFNLNKQWKITGLRELAAPATSAPAVEPSANEEQSPPSDAVAADPVD